MRGLLVAVLAVLVAAVSAEYHNFREQEIQCQNDKAYNVSYFGRGLHPRHYVSLNKVEGLMSIGAVGKNIMQMDLDFNTEHNANMFLKALELAHEGNDKVYLTSHGKQYESHKVPPVSEVIRAMVEGKPTHVALIVRHSNFMDGFSDLDLILEPLPEGHIGHENCKYAVTPVLNDIDHSKRVCVGLNTDSDNKDCDTPKEEIPLYSWAGPGGMSVTVTCSDCFVGFAADMFIFMVIQTTKLAKIEAGFKNCKLHSAFVLDVLATENFNVGLDKDMSFIPPTTLFSFDILTVPVTFWFQMPVHTLVNLGINLQAEVQAGFTSNIDYGDFYVKWDKHTPWRFIKGDPKVKTDSFINGTAQADANFIMTVVPTLQVFVDKVFHTDLTFTPQLTADANWQSETKELCVDVDYDLELTALAEFDLDIAWLGVHDTKVWGPITVWGTGKTPIEQKCVPVGEYVPQITA